jgi:hypothetical protein
LWHRDGIGDTDRAAAAADGEGRTQKRALSGTTGGGSGREKK